jgi:dTDP-4-amino-4,6-dideoxy-D-galactose acyltransferase
VDWDEAVFGVRTARLIPTEPDAAQLRTALAEIRAWDGRVAHLLLESGADESARAAADLGFRCVDVRVTLRWAAGPEPAPKATGALLRPARDADLGALERIARTSFGDSRYYRDGRYPAERCGDLYARWIRESCLGAAELVLVAEAAGSAAGFVTCHARAGGEAGSIGLFGVALEARGAGLASRLLGGAQEWFRGLPVGAVTVVTQGRNVAAQRAYQRRGFLTHAVQLWYHVWL